MRARALKRGLIVSFCGVLALAAYIGVRAYTCKAPQVTFVSLQGEQMTTQSLRGRVVLVTFWATDCAVCRKDMPALVETYDRYRSRGLEVIAVAMRYDPPNYVIRYAEQQRLPFKVALDPMGELARAFGDVQLTPTMLVIDKRGRVLERLQGEPDFGKLRALLERKLAETV